MAMRNKTANIYTEWLPLVESLPNEIAGVIFKNILKYQNGDDIKNDFPVWIFIKSKIDEYNDKLSQISEKRKENGKRGGLAKASKCQQMLASDSKCSNKIKENKIKENKIKENKIKDILDNVCVEMKPAIEKWLEYKKERKESYKPIGLSDCIKKLENLSNKNGDIAMQIVEQSTSNGYSGLFPLKSQQPKQEQSERKFLIEPFKFFIDDDEKNCPGYADLVKQLPESEWYKIGDWITNKFYGKEIGLSTIRTILTKAIQNKGVQNGN